MFKVVNQCRQVSFCQKNITIGIAKAFYGTIPIDVTRYKARDGTRLYKVPGATEPYPSVTSILSIINKKQLNNWSKKKSAESMLESLLQSPDRLAAAKGSKVIASKLVQQAVAAPMAVATEAATVGTNAHELLDTYILLDAPKRKEFLVSVPEAALPVLNAFDEWESKHGITVLEGDTIVYSHKHHFAGAMDALGQGRHDQELWALDWKTSNRLRQEYALQLGAYALAWNEMYPDRVVSRAGVVRFDKKKVKFEAMQLGDLVECQEMFLAALKLWQINNRRLLKKMTRENARALPLDQVEAAD